MVTEDMPLHTHSRTPPSRLRPVHENLRPIRQCFTPLCPFNVLIGSNLSRNNITATYTNTAGKSCQELVLEQKICRPTLLQERPLHVSAQGAKQCDRVGVRVRVRVRVRVKVSVRVRVRFVHPSAPLNISCV